VDGVPLVNRTVTFRTGVKWFSADIYRKMAPLSGTPDLLAQWHTSDPSIPQIKDVLTPPSRFTGRLKRRDTLSRDYDRFWTFFDCLRLHDTHQCKYCVGRRDMDDCRPVFTCVDNYPIELCDQTAFHTREQLAEKVAEYEDRQDGTEAVKTRLTELQRALDAVDRIALLSDLVLLDELYRRLDYLDVPDEKQDVVLRLRKELLRLRTAALEARMLGPSRLIASLSPTLRGELKATARRIRETEKRLRDIEAERRRVEPLADVTRELMDFLHLLEELKERLAGEGVPVDALKGWTLDTAGPGATIVAKTEELESLLAGVKRVKEEAAGEQPGTPEEAVAPALPVDPDIERIRGVIDALKERVNRVGSRLDSLSPGGVPAFDRWASSVDIVGSLPKALRAGRVFGALENLEKWASDAPGGDTSLRRSARSLAEEEAGLKEERNRLQKASGLLEMALVDDLSALKKAVADAGDDRTLRAADDQLMDLTALFATTDLDPAGMENHPAEAAACAALIEKADLASLRSRVEALESAFGRPVMVILDEEHPGSSPWILFVYLVVPVMIVLNLRRLARFVRSRRRRA